MQQKQPLNHGWLYKSAFFLGDAACTPDPDGFELVDLPHTNKLLPFNCFDETAYQFISCYKKTFTLPEKLEGKQVLLDFEGVMTAAEVWCNGMFLGGHEGGYTPFTIDITSAAKTGSENVVVVKVDSTERPDIPPFGGVVDFLTYGGIYREVQLRITDELRLERLWLTCPDPLSEVKTLVCGCEAESPAPCGVEVSVSLTGPDGREAGRAKGSFSLAPGTNRCTVSLEGLRNISLWELDAPALYTVTAELTGGSVTDTCTDRFGFRKAEFTEHGFFLNGRLVKLVGLDRHQSWPYVGYAMPERVQRRDAELLKRDAGCNIVRTSHYPQSKHFLDACDELGLLVVEEIPGWQHIGDLAWQDHAVQDVEDMIVRDFNRPSIILWGVRINESQDNHDFYVRTNETARRLDPTRQTGGTRCILRSELLEDVYTYNDFTHSGGEAVFRPQRESTGLGHDVPTLVTESNGHMYPTKRFDQEHRMVEHALRHLRVIDAAIGRDDLCGGISWCAFDYNTHGCFGSGDKVCYHGVYDMFRNPKYAAYSYASQKPPALGAVLEPITAASRGERDGGGSVPFYVLTNCDFIRVYKNDALVGDFYPEQAAFPHLAHPPVVVSHLMEAALDFGFSEEDGTRFKEFLTEKLRTGALTALGEPDMAYLASLAEKYKLSMRAFIGAVIRSAGGWGDVENDLRLEGFVGGEKVCTRRIGERKYAAGLTLVADDSVLFCDGETYDATRITVSVVDDVGNLMPFAHECVEIRLGGPAALLGPSRFPVIGGVSSFWIRTLDIPGEVTVNACGMDSTASCVVHIQTQYFKEDVTRGVRSPFGCRYD